MFHYKLMSNLGVQRSLSFFNNNLSLCFLLEIISFPIHMLDFFSRKSQKISSHFCYDVVQMILMRNKSTVHCQIMTRKRSQRVITLAAVMAVISSIWQPLFFTFVVIVQPDSLWKTALVTFWHGMERFLMALK